MQRREEKKHPITSKVIFTMWFRVGNECAFALKNAFHHTWPKYISEWFYCSTFQSVCGIQIERDSFSTVTNHLYGAKFLFTTFATIFFSVSLESIMNMLWTLDKQFRAKCGKRHKRRRIKEWERNTLVCMCVWCCNGNKIVNMHIAQQKCN